MASTICSRPTLEPWQVGWSCRHAMWLATPVALPPGRATGNNAVRTVTDAASAQRNPRMGYAFAAAAAAISGISAFVNSLGVRSFADPVLYTVLKDAFVGLILLVPLCFSSGWRADYRRLNYKTG